jgi:hypothetical protein
MFAWTAENPYDRVDDLVLGVRTEDGDLSNHQLLVGGEELTRPGVAVSAERARTEARRCQVNRSRIAVRVAGDLAEDPVATTSVGQSDSRTQLSLGQVREWERNENYRAG